MTEGFKPLRGERSVRFGCGAIAGALFGLYLAVRYAPEGSTVVWVVVAAAAFGLFASLLGDRFWRSIHQWLHWS